MRYQLAMTLTVSVEAELSLMAVWTLGDFNSLLAKPGHHALDADGKKVLRLSLIPRSAIALYVRHPSYLNTGKRWRARELPKNRRRTEVSVSFGGSAGASAGTITLHIELRSARVP
jgi:hypothetical protein